MSDAVISALIAATASVITTGGVVYLGIRKVKSSIDEVHILINSRMTELLTAAKAVGHGEGVAQERTEERDRHLAT